MSRQKDRHLKRTPCEDQVVAPVREIADLPFVIDVEDHFAGMWNELGIQIKVRSGTSDREVIGLRNDVLSCLRGMNQESEFPFTWIVGFWRDEKNIEVLLPRDDIRSVDEVLGTE